MEENTPPLAPEALLAEGAWVRRVARALVADEHGADDLSQEMWLKALQAPPRVRVSLRAWLGTVLRNAAADLRRGTARRRAREEVVARDEAVASAESVVARAEVLHRVAAAALALREPYRTVILLRYFEDLAPPEIARRLDVPLETVRTRLRRGLEILREEFGGGDRDRRALLLALLLALLPLPPGTLFPPGPGAWTGADAAIRAATLAQQEILAMSVRATTAAVLAILLAGGAAWWLLRDMETAPEPATPSADPEWSASGGRRAPAKAPAPGPAAVPANTGGGSPTPPDLGGGGTPTPPYAKKPVLLVIDTERADADRAVLEAREKAVTEDKARLAKMAPGGEFGTVVVRGRIVDAETGAGIARVPVRVFPGIDSKLQVSGMTDDSGAFEVRGVAKGRWSLGAGFQDSTSEYGSLHREFQGAPEEEVRIELRKGLVIQGRIEDAEGRAYAGDSLVLAWELDAAGVWIPATQQWVYGTKGAFQLRGMAPGPHRVTVTTINAVRQDGTTEPTVTTALASVEAGTTDLVVRLPAAAPVEGRILDAQGNPITARGTVRLFPSGGIRGLLRQTEVVSATVPGDGTFRTPPVDPGAFYDIEVTKFEGYRALTKERVAGGKTGVEIVLEKE